VTKPRLRLRVPQLAVKWESRGQTFAGSLWAVMKGPKAPKEFRGEPYFRDCHVRRLFPKGAMLASSLWYVVLFLIPIPIWQALTPKQSQPQLALPRIELTWYEPARDLAAITQPGELPKPSPPGEPEKPLPKRGADAFHPRQSILSSPLKPTHPRQTLIRPDAPLEPPKLLPQMPNIVQWAQPANPARPRLHINTAALAKLRPKRPAQRPLAEMAVPNVPNQEQNVGDLNIASSATQLERPRLAMNPSSAPRVGQRQNGTEAGPAPNLAPDVSASDSGLRRLIALSAAPAPPAETLPLPEGNLAARLSISPDGAQPGTPGGSPNGPTRATGNAGGAAGSPGGAGGAGATKPGTGGGGGSGLPNVSITGGDPRAMSSVTGPGGSGLPGAGGVSPGMPAKPEPRPARPEPNRTRPAPGFDRIKPGMAPEEIFGPKRIYTLHVNMPNLASVTGSWILSFVEMGADPVPGQPPDSDLTGPVPMRKVDPKYPPALASARIEGEVILYAVIRRDGTVDSIQLVKSLDPQLDENAALALSRWRFRPAERSGTPVELEAIVHIPFRSVSPLY